MLRSLFTAATGMEAQQTKMDVIANNLANASTTGFKKGRPEFEELLSDTIKTGAAPDPRGGNDPSPLQVGLGVKTGATSRSLAQGDVQLTSNQTDLAIQGDGFFRVQRANGDYAYTRAGNFRVDATGRLTTQNGEAVDPAITVPPETTSITITGAGLVTAAVPGTITPRELGTIELATFQNPQGLLSIGNNLMTASAGSGDAVMVKPGERGAGSVAQGALETANVKAVEEMIDMISAQRAYEMNSKVIQTADQMLNRLTSLR